MFKVRRKGMKEIVQVLDVTVIDPMGVSYFFIWENDGWRWRSADNFVPPNYKGDLE